MTLVPGHIDNWHSQYMLTHMVQGQQGLTYQGTTLLKAEERSSAINVLYILKVVFMHRPLV